MRVIIQSDYQKMSQWAANHVIKRINEFNPTPDHKFVLGLPTGSLQSVIFYTGLCPTSFCYSHRKFTI